MIFSFTTDLMGTADVVSLDLPDESAAWKEAVRACGELIQDVDGRMRLPADIVMNVADGTGRDLFELRFSSRAF
jgi:hypothetical protein